MPWVLYLWHTAERRNTSPYKTMSDFQAFNAYLDQDDTYQSTLKRHQEMWKEAKQAEIEVTHALRRVTRLMMAVDVVRQQQWKHEDISEEQNKALEDLTTDDSEIWFSQYGRAADDIEEAAVAACAMVIEKRQEAKVKKIEAREHCILLDFAKEQAREAFDKQKAEAEATAEQTESTYEAVK
jgi:hypothetical protein